MKKFFYYINFNSGVLCPKTDIMTNYNARANAEQKRASINNISLTNILFMNGTHLFVGNSTIVFQFIQKQSYIIYRISAFSWISQDFTQVLLPETFVCEIFVMWKEIKTSTFESHLKDPRNFTQRALTILFNSHDFPFLKKRNCCWSLNPI